MALDTPGAGARADHHRAVCADVVHAVVLRDVARRRRADDAAMKKRIDKFMSSASGAPVGGTPEQPMMIMAPLIIMFEQDGKIVCHLHPRPDDNHRGYGLLICDLV